MPSGLARELAYTSRNLSAEEALGCGFVNHVYQDQAEMIIAAQELAKKIAKHSPLAVAGVKQMLNHSRDHNWLIVLTIWPPGKPVCYRAPMSVKQ